MVPVIPDIPFFSAFTTLTSFCSLIPLLFLTLLSAGKSRLTGNLCLGSPSLAHPSSPCLKSLFMALCLPLETLKVLNASKVSAQI